MDIYNKLLELTSEDTVELGASFKDLLHKKLVLGQTRYVCRYGTLSDGHEKITDAQRYFQAIKEMYCLASNIRAQKANAMIAQADILDAQEALSKATNEAEKLRATGKLMQHQERLLNSLVTVEDQLRMLDEFNKIRQELEPAVEAKYPLGIEQAEEDNWRAVFEYRMIKSQSTGGERTDNIPLPPESKAELGARYNRFDAIAPKIVADRAATLAPASDKVLLKK